MEQGHDVVIINDLEENEEQNFIIEEAEDNDSSEEAEEEITEQEALVRYALTLDTEGTANANNRPARNGEGKVEIVKKKQFDTHARMLILVYAACFMDYKNPLHTKAERERIKEAACNLVCYDLGYKKRLGVFMVDRWIEILEQSARIQVHLFGLKSRHKGTARGSFIAQVEREHHTYLISLYWYATSIYGDDLTFQQLADTMNVKANIDQVVPGFNVSVGQLKRWFRSMKGKQLSPSEKPYLTPEHLAVRIAYAIRILHLQREGRHICYLDEKWFYTMS